MPSISRTSVTLGADPELFFEMDGHIIGAEKVLPPNGLKVIKNPMPSVSKVIIDGVQVEMNPTSDTCRQRLSSGIKACFHTLEGRMAVTPGLKLNFDVTVPIRQEEMDSLSEKSRSFGCTPSFNVYDGKAKVGVKDPSKYLFRSAGGHVHLGSYTIKGKEARVIRILDIILGNTCVLIDRDPGNIERRKHYGRAGEYRTPSYGVEYRTLSNFWLRSYTLMSFVFSLARLGVDIVYSSDKFGKTVGNPEKELLDAVKEKDIIKAINNNDFDLAMKNFNKIAPIMEKYCMHGDALSTKSQLAFRSLVKKGIKVAFKADPVKNWARGYYDVPGWESYAEQNPGSVMEEVKQITKTITRRSPRALTTA